MKIILSLFFLFISLNAKEIYATFDVVAQRDAKLAFIANGIVAHINVDIGSVVKKGDILATLQNADIKASLDLAEIALKYAKRSYDREIKIKHLIDEAKFDKVAQAYENAKVALAYKKVLYEKTFLKAPFDGIIYKRNIELGDAVSAVKLNQVFHIQSAKKRKFILYFDQKYINQIQSGDTFKYKLDGEKQQHSLKILKVYPYANYNNRKGCAEVITQDVTSGLFGDGFIITKGK